MHPTYPALTTSAPPQQCLSGWRFVGDPIDVVTGASTDITVDFQLAGPLPLRWRRYYDSGRNTVAGSLGWGHSHDFDRTLTYDLDGLHYTDPFGKQVPFPPLGIGRRAAAAGLLLLRTGQTTYELRQAEQPVQGFEFTAASDIAPLRRLEQNGGSILFRYDGSGRLCEIVDSLQRMILVETDRSGKISGIFLTESSGPKGRRALMRYLYDPAGNIITAHDAYNAVLRFKWDHHHRMTGRTDRLGYSFHFNYDEEGRCVHSRGDDGLLEVFLDYQPDAKTTIVRRGDGGQWIYLYNENKALTQITDPAGSATQFRFDGQGRQVEEIDPNGNITVLHYDWKGRHDYCIDPTGNVRPTKEASSHAADPLAYPFPTTASGWDFGGLLSANANRPLPTRDSLLTEFPLAVVNWISGSAQRGQGSRAPFPQEDYLLTDLGGPANTTGPRLTRTWKHDANGNLTERRDADGSVYRSVYTSWNALTQMIDPLGHITSFNLTVQGLMAKVTDPGGTVTEYRYDLQERLIEVRENERLVERYRRDAAGNVIEKKNAAGKTLVTWEVGPGNLDTVQTLASGEIHRFGYGGGGRLLKAEAPSGLVTFAYNDDGKLVADQRDGRGVVHEYKLKRLAATTYFERFRMEYRSFADGDLGVRDPAGGRHRIQTLKTGMAVKLLASGARELSEFDLEGRCIRKALARAAHDSAPWLRSYEYSAAGDLVAVIDNRKGTTKYRHDAAHRLVEEVPPDGPARPYELDGAGNLRRQPGLSDVIIGEGNRLNEANGEDFTYNDRNNLSQREGPAGFVRYEYNDLDLLVRCEIKGEPWTARYDSFCRRVQKTWRGETTTYYWDGVRLAAEVYHDGSCRLYFYVDDTALSPFLFIDYERVDANPESGRRYYIFTNQVSAPVRVEDDNGQTMWSARIDPYGKTHVEPGSKISLHLRFPGHYFDPETGLHYNRFRYFSPELGRYLESDPAGLSGGINAYAYPARPLTTVDVNGLGAKTASRPKTKKGPPPEVGCKAPLQAGLTPEQVKAELEKKVTKLRLEMEAAKAAGHKQVIAPDGSVLTVHPSMGPCLSAVYDSKTGKVYYGQNTGKAPTNLREPLQSNTMETARENYLKTGMMEGYPEKGDTITQPYGSLPGKGIPGSHGEVNATDKAMRDRDQQRANDPSVPPPETKDMVIYNQNTTGQSQDKGAGKECCPNCKRILGTEKPGDNPPGQHKGPVDVSD